MSNKRTEIEAVGGIRMGGSRDGKAMTLDPISVVTVPLEVREVESAILAGLQQVWGEMEVDGEEFSISSGAGLGSEWGRIRYAGKDYVFSATQLAAAFLDAVKEKENEE